MNAYDLRKHLSKGHHIDLWGLNYAELVAVHDNEHLAVQGHYHDDPLDGDT